MLDFKKIVHKPGHFQIHFSILGKIMFLCIGLKKDLPQFSCIIHLFKYVVIIFLRLRHLASFFYWDSCLHFILDKLIPTQNMYYRPFKWNKPYLDWSLFDDCINLCISFQTQSSSIPECRKLNRICTQYDNISKFDITMLQLGTKDIRQSIYT